MTEPATWAWTRSAGTGIRWPIPWWGRAVLKLWWRKTRSRCDPDVAMMDARRASASRRHGPSLAARHRVASARRPRATVGAVRVVVPDVLAQDPTQVVLAEHDYVLNDLPTRGAHPSFGDPFCQGQRGAIRSCVRPRFSTRRSNTAPKILSRSRISRASPTSGPTAWTIRCAPPTRPLVLGDVHVDHATAFERQHEEHVQHAERHCQPEKVDRNRADGVVRM